MQKRFFTTTFLVLLSCIIIPAFTSADTSFSAPQLIDDQSAPTQISRFSPDPLGFLLAQSTNSQCYSLDQSDNYTLIPESTLPDITPQIVELIYPSDEGSWRDSSSNYLEYYYKDFDFSSPDYTQHQDGMFLDSDLHLIDGVDASSTYITIPLKMGYWVSSSTTRTKQIFCISSTMDYLYQGATTESSSSTGDRTYNLFKDTSRDITFESDTVYPAYAIGWDQDNNRFMALRQDTNTIFINDIATSSPDDSLSLPAVLSTTTVKLGTKRNNRTAMAFSEIDTLYLWYEGVDSFWSVPQTTFSSTDSALWIDNNGNLFFFSPSGTMVYTSSDGSENIPWDAAETGEQVLDGSLNHYSTYPMAIFLIDDGQGSQLLRLVEWRDHSWASTDLPHLTTSTMAPGTLGLETTYSADLIITIKTQSPTERWYYLQGDSPSSNEYWQFYL